MRLILARHGQTTSNVDRLLDTDAPGADLTDLGREQASALVDALAEHPITAIWTSTLVRTHQTAAPLAATRGIEPVVRDGLREVRAGDHEMLSDQESIEAYLGAVFRWSAGDLDHGLPGGETGVEFFERYDAVVAEAAGAGHECVLVVSHGAAIRCWVAARATNLDADIVAPVPLGNTGIVVLEGGLDEGWTAVSWEGRVLGAVVGPGGLVEDGPAGDPVDETSG